MNRVIPILNNNNNNNDSKNKNNNKINTDFEYEYSNTGSVDNNETNNTNKNTNKKPVTLEDKVKDAISKDKYDEVVALLIPFRGNPSSIPKGLVNYATEVALAKSSNSNSKSKLKILNFLVKTLNLNSDEQDPRMPNFTPMNHVAKVDSDFALEVFTFLKENSAHIDGIKTDYGISTSTPPIFTAIEFGNKRIFDALIDSNVNINKFDKPESQGGVPPIYKAVEAQWPYAVDRLLKQNAKLTFKNLIGDNIFITAVKLEFSKERDEIIQSFLNSPSIEFNFVNADGMNVLMVVASMGDLPLFNKLLDYGKARETLFYKGKRGTILDIVYNRLDDLKYLDSKEETESLKRKKKNLETIMNILIGKGLTINIETFFNAIKNHDLSTIKLFLKMNINIVKVLDNAYNPITLASSVGDIDVLTLFKDAGKLTPVTINTEDDLGNKPIDYALMEQNMELLDFLIENGATKEDLLAEIINTSENTEAETLDILTAVIEKYHLDPNTPNKYGSTPLTYAISRNLEDIVRYLLQSGADVNKTITVGTNELTAYDYALNMSMRLLLAPYMEKDKPRFRGFIEDDFQFIKDVVKDVINYAICPFCFVPLQRGDAGCMYLYTHNCLLDQEQWEAAGLTIFVHKKLFETYLDARNKITVCHHCNRAGYSFTTEMHQGAQGPVELMGHQHVALRSANPYIEPQRAPYVGVTQLETGCESQGGGSHFEKMTRFQTLVCFMCFLNKYFIGKISNRKAHLLCREMFWDAPLYNYITDKRFSKSIDDEKLTGFASQIDLVQYLLKNKKLIMPKDCKPPAVLPPIIEAKEEEFPNVPRFGTNTVDLAPIETTELAGVRNCWIQENIIMDAPHGDGRRMWGFRHRQPGLTNVYDHNAKKEWVCGPCLTEFIDTLSKGSFSCFNRDQCKGHFHPTELEGKIPDAVYQKYRKAYNRLTPKLGGGSSNLNEKDYPRLIGPPVFLKQDTCPVPYTGGKRRRRVTRKAKKYNSNTRRNKRYTKTRKH